MMDRDGVSARAAGQDSPRRLYPFFLLFAAGILYGLTFSLTRMATTEGVPFLAFLFWQTFGAAALTLFFCLARREPPIFGRLHLRAYLVIALSGLLTPFGVFAFVAPKLPAGVVSMTISLAPTMTLLFALGLKMERFNLWRLAGVLLGIAGVLLVIVPKTSLPSPDMAAWVVLALAGPVGLAFGNIAVVKLRPPGTASHRFTAGILCVGSLLLLPVALGVHGVWLFDGPFGTGHVALLATIPVIAVLWFLAMELAALTGSVFLSLFDYVATLAGVGWGILFFAEHHSLWLWTALALLLAGVYLVNKTGKAVRKASASSL
jgi:drug/metabolite transporter (DMT)-like permease